MSKIFINYRRTDSGGYSSHLYDRLTRQFSNDEVFMDIDDIDLGKDFREVLQKKLSTVEVGIVLIGEKWLDIKDETTGQRRLDDKKDFVRFEIATMLERKILVIPVLVGDANLPEARQLPEPLAPLLDRQAHRININSRDFLRDTEKLIKSIQRYLEFIERVEDQRKKDEQEDREKRKKKKESEKEWQRNKQNSLESESYPFIEIISLLPDIRLDNKEFLIFLAIVAILAIPLRAFFTNETPPKPSQIMSEAVENVNDDISKLKKNAAQGDANAQYNLGKKYSVGSGVTQDEDLATEWIRKAAQRGHADAQIYLSKIIDTQINKDRVKEIKSFPQELSTARQEDTETQNNPGLMTSNVIRPRMKPKPIELY